MFGSLTTETSPVLDKTDLFPLLPVFAETEDNLAGSFSVVGREADDSWAAYGLLKSILCTLIIVCVSDLSVFPIFIPIVANLTPYCHSLHTGGEVAHVDEDLDIF